MSKSDLIDAVIASTPGTSRVAASTIVETVFGAISTKLGAGEDFRISGFGNFSVKDRAARKGRNPATGVSIDIPESRRVAFSASSDLKTLVAPKSKKKTAPKAKPTGKPGKVAAKAPAKATAKAAKKG